MASLQDDGGTCNNSDNMQHQHTLHLLLVSMVLHGQGHDGQLLTMPGVARAEVSVCVTQPALSPLSWNTSYAEGNVVAICAGGSSGAGEVCRGGGSGGEVLLLLPLLLLIHCSTASHHW